ncbi:hypothetical protein C0J52_06691 [Blattella germanica]|nr:hypothetical protein C0J52_06691 [Blattella germanica]
MQRKILGITRRDRIPNKVLRQRAQATEIHRASSYQQEMEMGRPCHTVEGQQMDHTRPQCGTPA